MRKSYVPVPAVSRTQVTDFRGINQHPGANENEWADLCNMVVDNGCLRTRNARGIAVNEMQTADGNAEAFDMYVLSSKIEDICALHDGYALITEGGELVVNGKQLRAGSPKADTKRFLVPFGRSFMILPDGILYTPADDGTWQFQSVENTFAASGATVCACEADGTEIDATFSDIAPENPENGTAWADTSGATTVLRYWSAAQNTWVQATSLYMKIATEGIGHGFRQGDVVELDGFSVKELNGSFELIAVQDDFLVVVCVSLCADYEQTEPFTVSRSMPVLDFCVQHNNRLWGCRKGRNHKGDYVNEIYASKLGDPLNWFCYQGISTDSYAVSIASPGEFTGVGTTTDAVVFFKSDSVSAVYGSAPSDFTVTTFQCEGVQPGSAKSVVTVNGAIYYKSSNGVYVFSGYQPYCVSDALTAKYTNAAAACAGDKYYVRMTDGNNEDKLFVYDTLLHIWVRENCMQNCLLFSKNNAVYLVSQAEFSESINMGDSQITLLSFVEVCMYVYDLTAPDCVDLTLLPRSESDSVQILSCSYKTEAEVQNISFIAESGDLGLLTPDHKRTSLLQIRVRMEKGSALKVSAQYDGGAWVQLHETIAGKHIDSVCLPVACRRCDRMRIRLEGYGNVTVYGITRTTENASEVSVLRW